MQNKFGQDTWKTFLSYRAHNDVKCDISRLSGHLYDKSILIFYEPFLTLPRTVYYQHAEQIWAGCMQFFLLLVIAPINNINGDADADSEADDAELQLTWTPIFNSQFEVTTWHKCQKSDLDHKLWSHPSSRGQCSLLTIGHFHSLEVVDRVSETQLQVSENSNVP